MSLVRGGERIFLERQEEFLEEASMRFHEEVLDQGRLELVRHLLGFTIEIKKHSGCLLFIEDWLKDVCEEPVEELVFVGHQLGGRF